MKDMKKTLSAILAASMLVTAFVPAFADPVDVVSPITLEPLAETSTQTEKIKLNVNYFTTETENKYKIDLTVMEEIPAFTKLSFSATVSGGDVFDADFDPALLATASNNKVMRDNNGTTEFTLERSTAAKIDAKSKLCTLTVSAPAVPDTTNFIISALTIINEAGDSVSLTADPVFQEGPIIPPLDDTTKAVYDSILALPNPKTISFYQEDGSLCDLDDLSKKINAVKTAHQNLTEAQKECLASNMEYDGHTMDNLTALSTLLDTMETFTGLFELENIVKSMTAETALSYQFVAHVYNTKKATFDSTILPAESKAITDIATANNTLTTASETIATAFSEASYDKKSLACENQINVVKGLSKHLYYTDYKADILAQITNLEQDIRSNYTDSEIFKKAMLEQLDDCKTMLDGINQSVSDIPTIKVDRIQIGHNYSITYTRKYPLSESQTAKLYATVTDKATGQIIDQSEREFPNSLTTYNLRITASNTYPKNDYAIISAYYILDGVSFLVDTEEVLCEKASASAPSEPISGIGVPVTGNNNGPVGSGNNNDEKYPNPSVSGGTIFPSNESNNQNDNEDTPEKEEPSLFTDMANHPWAKEAVEGLYYAGIINGMEEGIFNPAGAVTREQFSKMVVQLFGVSTNEINTKFIDVNPTAWYAPYIASAMQAGYIQGQSNEYFGIGESIMRQDMATILYRALGDQNSRAVLNFSDVDNIAPYAMDAIAELVGLKVINGYEDGSFNPRGTATRAEAAKMIWGIYQIIHN